MPMFSTLNLARIAKVVALLLFFLPWVTVSCAEQTLISMTGFDLATGNLTMTNPVTHVSESPPGGGKGDLLVVIGAALILLSLAVTFVMKGRTGVLAAIVGTVLAGVALAYTVLVRIPVSARAGALAGSDGGGSGGMNQAQIAEMIKVNVEIGFWLMLAALAAAAVLGFMALKGSAAPAAAASAPTEPPGG
jgi:hypothetical protein